MKGRVGRVGVGRKGKWSRGVMGKGWKGRKGREEYEGDRKEKGEGEGRTGEANKNYDYNRLRGCSRDVNLVYHTLREMSMTRSRTWRELQLTSVFFFRYLHPTYIHSLRCNGMTASEFREAVTMIRLFDSAPSNSI